MEASKEPISLRTGRINAQILGKLKASEEDLNVFTREGLLDALQVLYDECSAEYLKNVDKNVQTFVDKNRKTICGIKQLRVSLADFEVKNVIGSGHFGEVHLVKEKQTGDMYAMKTIKKYESLEQKNCTFEIERNIMAFADSAWLTSLRYAFQDGINLYFVMEYHPGGDLLGLLYRQGGTLPESACTFYIAELVVALNDLHTMRYVHRDIKPENILLDRCGHLKIVDFGSATKLCSDGIMTDVLPVGTSDYVAPELLQSLDNKTKKATYGVSCDYWSLGVLAYELTIGSTPFNAQNISSVYSKIMNYKSSLKFPPDVVLSQGYVSLIKGLLTDQNSRLTYRDIRKHPHFTNVDFDSLRDQVPPYVPKIDSVDDTSNFTDVQRKKNEPHIDSFKIKTKFSGKNLPFIGFTYTGSPSNDYYRENPVTDFAKDKTVQNLKKEIDSLQRKLMKTQDSFQEKDGLEKKLEERTRKVENLESLRVQLERDLANSIAECSSLKRRLEFERKEHSDLEQKALELIKAAKLKWETSEKKELDALNKQISEYKKKISQIQNENASLKLQLDRAIILENTDKTSLDKVDGLNRQSVIGLESRLEKVTSQSQNQIAEIQSKLNAEINAKLQLEKVIDNLKKGESDSNLALQACTGKLVELQKQFEELQEEIKNKDKVVCRLEENKTSISKYEADIAQLKNERQALLNNKKEKEIRESELKKERDICAKLKQEIEDLKTEITFEKLAHQTIFEDLTLKHKNKIVHLESKVRETLNQSNELEFKLKEAELNDENNKAKVKTLEDLLVKLEKGVLKLESSSEREPVLQEQVKRLELQLGELHETLALEKQELLKLKSKYWRMEKDLQNAELDKKIVERDLKESKVQNNQLTAEVRKLNENMGQSKKKHEKALFELNTLNENLANEVYKLKDLIENLESNVRREKEKFDEEKNCVFKLQDEVNNNEKRICVLVKELECYKMQLAEAERQILNCEKNNSNLILRLESLMKEKSNLLDEIENYKQEQHNNQLNRNALRDACTVLEHQLDAYENLCGATQSENASLKVEIEKLTDDLIKSKQETVDARRMTNEEKSLKLLAETKYKRLQEDIESLQKECDSHKNKCAEFKDYSKCLSAELNSAEQKITNLEMELKASGRRIENFVSENCSLKEEHSLQLSHVNKMKESNYKLNQNLSEFKMNNHILMQKVNDLENNFLEKTKYHRERELKYEATIQQQTKLIDFLQLKVEDSKKKKTLSDKLFGHSKKENQPPFPAVYNYKDLEMQLNKEREITRNLRQEIVKLKNELILPAETDVTKYPSLDLDERRKVSEHIVQSPNSQNDLFRQNSVQRMYHNIPHRFETKLCMKTAKCSQCNNQLLLGRNMSVCRECNIPVHPDCVNILPRTCGLPQAYAKHYSDSLSRLEDLKHNPSKTPSNEELIDVEGWVKIPTKGSWEKHYACLTSSALRIYKEPPNKTNIEVVECLELDQPGTSGKVTLEPLISEIGTPVVSSDLPFVIKVEIAPNTTCWPPTCIIFMALSTEDKENWYRALQKTFGVNTGKYTGEHVMKLDGNLQVNCLVDTNEVKLLGAEQGLYSYHKNGLSYIAGLLSVHQITLLPSINLALMIANENRVLISCDLKHLTAVALCVIKPTLIFKIVNVKNLSGFHVFQVSDFLKQCMLCIATARQIVIMSYDYETQQFNAERVLDTAEPTSCILFTQHSLIIGADKYFEIDVRTYDADEFLDASDVRLSHVTKCYKKKSFPVAILRVSEKPVEYLLCFNEFGTFVDEFGRSTRSYDIKWTHLPHAFYYHKHYLYVCQFYAVEIMKITLDGSDDFNVSTQDSVKIELDNMKYLGHSKQGVYVQANREVKHVSNAGLESVDISLNSETTDENDLANNSDRFSFTSSVMHSLDGNLSDPESVSSEGKTHRRVKFAHTTDL